MQYRKQDFVFCGKMMAAILSSGDVERVLMHMGMIAPEAEIAFRARLKHLQRLGIPIGSNTGKGRRVPHTLDTLFQLVIALDLMQVGIPPAMVARTLSWNWDTIRRALLLIAAPGSMRANRTGWQDSALFLLQSPHALEALMDIKTPEAERWYDDVRVVHSSQLVDAIMAGDVEKIGPGRAIVLNLSWLVEEALMELRAVNPKYEPAEAWREWRAISERYMLREIDLVDDEEAQNVDQKA